MPKKKPYARIAITLPRQDLAAADRLARVQDRSRSWIVAEAIRRYAALQEARVDPGASADKMVNEMPVRPPPSLAGLGASRLAQLRRDLALTPEARVRAAEETLRLTERRGRAGAGSQRVVTFDSYEAFLDWKGRPDAQR